MAQFVKLWYGSRLLHYLGLNILQGTESINALYLRNDSTPVFDIVPI